jgi:putative phosphoribosyl transferase
MFKNRKEAAELLVERLDKFKDTDSVILAIPRGGVPIGHYLATKLNLEMDIALSKKIGHPLNPEFAIGSVSLYGSNVNTGISEISENYIKRETENLLNKLRQKHQLYTKNRKPIIIKNRTVIVTDDGIATGNTMHGIIVMLKKIQPSQIIIAVPVAPPDTVYNLKKEVDEIICLDTPWNFMAVGQFYEEFSQVEDDEVISLLNDPKVKKTNKINH